MKEEIIKATKEKMEKALHAFQGEIAKLRTGRASLAILDDVKVDYYGQMVPLNQVASLSVPEPRLITIAPWEHKIIPAIEKAIEKANLGLMPANDGKIVRVPIPSLTEERRKEMVKMVKHFGEESRVGVRHARREAIDELKTAEKKGLLTEDDLKKLSAQVQKMTDDYTAKVDESVLKKEKEVLQV